MADETVEEVVILSEEELGLDDPLLLQQQEEDKMLLAKEEAKIRLESIRVKVNNIAYDGNMDAQSNMGDAGTIANWFFNKTLTDTLAQVAKAPDATNELKYIAGLFSQVYDGVYKKNPIEWRGADNKMHSVQGESVLEALHKTMLEKSTIIKGEDDDS